jgi:hypothetical protein
VCLEVLIIVSGKYNCIEILMTAVAIYGQRNPQGDHALEILLTKQEYHYSSIHFYLATAVA